MDPLHSLLLTVVVSFSGFAFGFFAGRKEQKRELSPFIEELCAQVWLDEAPTVALHVSGYGSRYVVKVGGKYAVPITKSEYDALSEAIDHTLKSRLVEGKLH